MLVFSSKPIKMSPNKEEKERYVQLMNHAMLLNVIMILFIAIASFRIRSLLFHLCLIFLYISLHYSYGLLPIFFDDEASFHAFNLARTYTNPALPLMGLACITYLLAFPFVAYRPTLSVLPFASFTQQWHIRILMLFMLAWLGSLLVFFYSRESAEIQVVLKLLLTQGITISCAFLLTYFFSVLLRGRFEKREMKALITFMFIFTLLMTSIAFAEVLFRKTWICCTWVRPSALLLNPNNLAFWYLAVSGIFSIAYLYDVKEKWASAGIVLSAVGMFLTGSRSIFIIYGLFSLLLLSCILLFKGSVRRGVKTLLYFYLPFALLCVIPQCLDGNSLFLSDLQKTSARYLLILPLLYEYFFSNHLVNLSDTYFAKHFIVAHYSSYSGLNLADNGMVNIQGRLSEASTDNAYLMMAKNMSWQLLFSWGMLMMVPLFFCAIYAMMRKSLVGAMLVALYTVILLSGLSINIFLVFPDWMIVSSLIGVLLAWITSQHEKGKVI